MSATVEAAAGVFGLVIGSFLGVVVDRIPRKESIVSPPSHCVSCSAPIRGYDNIPVVSYLVLRGRCRACGVHIPPRDAVLELGTGALFVLLAWRLASVWALPAFCVLAASLIAISAIDVEHLRIPSPIVYATAVLGVPLLVLASAGTHRWTALLAAVIGGAAAFAAFFALFYAVPKGIGFGDVRLAGVCGGFLGWIGYREVILAFVLSFIVAGVPAAILLALHKVQRRTQIPFGPFLAGGTVITVLFGPSIVHAWTG
jgi:leader peptidase (prepilin peptidase)/N-methyltransferase